MKKKAFGNFIKVIFIGKPRLQSYDRKYYIAVNFVGVKGIPESSIGK